MPNPNPTSHRHSADNVSTNTDSISPIILSRDEHSISRKQISRATLNILYELNRNGYEAYLVGGCIRDLLLGKAPKDFDIATNATPEEVHRLFRRSRIVGRRFKIVHVRIAGEVIEVTTFRGAHTSENKGQSRSQVSEQGMLLRDNVYGTLRDDALRRDFTVNALYYTVDGFKVLDYTTGLEDLRNKTLRIIGEAEQRYREDPVRMLRAMRFAAKLGFDLHPDTAEPVHQLGSLLSHVSPARLFDEIVILFLTGFGEDALHYLRNFQLLEPFLGEASKDLHDEQSGLSRLVAEILQNTDNRIANEQHVTPAFLFAGLLWKSYCEHRDSLCSDGMQLWQASQQAGQYAIDQQQVHTSIPRRFGVTIRDIWHLQRTLASANGKRAIKLLGHPRFRAAYDFLLLRERSGETMERGAQYWTELQEKHTDAVKQSPKGHRSKRRRYQSGHSGRP